MRKKILTLRNQGLSYGEIAKRLGMSKSGVAHHANERRRTLAIVNHAKNQRQRLTQFKIDMGGKCVRCGYSQCLDALQFHHRNPQEKEIGVTVILRYGIERAKQEARKCDLVCANCHFEIHSKL